MKFMSGSTNREVMGTGITVCRAVAFLCALGGLLIAGPLAAAPKTEARQAPRAARPTFDRVERAAQDVFKRRQGYQPGDIIDRSEVQAALAEIDRLGWKPADTREILAEVPGDDEFLVKHLRRADARDFMRHVSRMPGGYDRVDRLLRLPYGRQFTQNLIDTPGGWKMFEYMTSSPGGTELGKQLSNAPDGKNFNKPTGRIYTAEDFLGRLRKSYERPAL